MLGYVLRSVAREGLRVCLHAADVLGRPAWYLGVCLHPAEVLGTPAWYHSSLVELDRAFEGGLVTRGAVQRLPQLAALG